MASSTMRASVGTSPVHGSDELDDGRTRGHRLEASAVPAVAQRARLVEGRVSDLARGARGAAQQPAVDHEARPDAGRDLDVGEVRALAAGAPGQLGEGTEVRVVLDLDRHPKAVAHLVRDAEHRSSPAGWWPTRRCRVRGRPARGFRCRRRSRTSGPPRPPPGPRPPSGRPRRGPASASWLDVEIAAPLRQHVVADVGDGDPHVAVPEVDADHRQGGVAQHQQDGRPAAANVWNARLDLVQEARILELGRRACARSCATGRSTRAMSAWLIRPRSRSTPTTRSRLRSRSHPSVPSPPFFAIATESWRAHRSLSRARTNCEGNAYHTLDKLEVLGNALGDRRAFAAMDF